MLITYAIICPRTGLFVYVGQTTSYRKRMAAHRRVAKSAKKARAGIKRWLQEMRAAGLKPRFKQLEKTHSLAASLASETYWITRLAAEGHPLLNRISYHRHIIKEASQWSPFRSATNQPGTPGSSPSKTRKQPSVAGSSCSRSPRTRPSARPARSRLRSRMRKGAW